LAKLRFKSPKGEFEGEYVIDRELSPEELADYYGAMLAKVQAHPSSRSKPPQSTPLPVSGTFEAVARPDYRDMAKYIEKKPNFEHTAVELMNHFYGRTLSSREPDFTEYNAFIHRLQRAHKQIERANHGRFQSARSTEYQPTGRAIQRTTYKFVVEGSRTDLGAPVQIRRVADK
jgi:hypothetical protein